MFMFVILSVTALLVFAFVFVIAFVSVIMGLIVIVNNHCDRVRDDHRIFVCMTVIVIVTVTLTVF